MKNNQSGSVFASVILFMITFAITINMTIDFFRLNSSIQVVSAQSQDKIFLKGDLEKQARIVSSIRLSLMDPNNPEFKGCVLSACVHSSPQDFFLASPMSPQVGKPNFPIAGTRLSPTKYTAFGEPCMTAGCENSPYLAHAFYNIEGTELKIWIVLKSSRATGMPVLKPDEPTARYQLSDVFHVY